jgi:hypothetical protein
MAIFRFAVTVTKSAEAELAAFFHLMPDTMATAGLLFGWWMRLAFVGLFGVERFVAPHRYEAIEPGQEDGHGHSPVVAPPLAVVAAP